MYEAIATPFFLIQVEKIECLVGSIKEALHKRWPQGIIGYSFKTNNLPWIIQHMRNLGLWAEVVSSDEYQLAERLGFDASRIIFNGPVKMKEEFIRAVENGSVVNLDSKRELSWLLECSPEKMERAKIGLRVNFCIEDYCRGESQCGEEDGRFGFSYECGELYDAITFLRAHKVNIAGLHIHCSSKTRSLNIYTAIAETAAKIVKEYNLNLQYVDIGGGYFGGVAGKPTFDDYFARVYRIFCDEPLLKNTNVIIEPGMSVVGAGISYVTEVIDVKQTKNNRFVLLDGSRIHVDPLMRKKEYSYHIERKYEGESNEREQILCGFTCMEADRFFKFEGPELRVGDRVVFEKVGAYTIGLSPQFIEFYPPVWAERDGTVVLVQQKRDADYFIGRKQDGGQFL